MSKPGGVGRPESPRIRRLLYVCPALWVGVVVVDVRESINMPRTGLWGASFRLKMSAVQNSGRFEPLNVSAAGTIVVPSRFEVDFHIESHVQVAGPDCPCSRNQPKGLYPALPSALPKFVIPANGII